MRSDNYVFAYGDRKSGSKYFDILEIGWESSDFVLSHVQSMYIQLQCIENCSARSFIPLPKKLANKKAVINPKNEDDFCFAYAIIVALNHKEIDHHPERISNLKKLISSYNWKRISMPVQKRLGTIWRR